MPGKAALVYSRDLAAYRHADWHPLQPRRVELTVQTIEELGLTRLENVEVHAPRPASDGEVELIHSPEYVDVVKRLGHGDDVAIEAVVEAGFAHSDNPVFENMHEASALVAGGSLKAAELVDAGLVDHAFSPAGGLHHAMRSLAWGFCVYNDVAIAARWLKERGHRVAVIDVDVHHGDGTQAAFYTDPDVLTISLHGFYRGFFPGTGTTDERGIGKGEGANLNVPLPAFTWDEPWLAAFDAVVPAALRSFRPTVLVTQDGCDTHLLDPLAELRCSTRIWPHVARTFHELAHELCQGRWVALGGGGYAVDEVVPRAWTILFAELAGVPELAAHLIDEKSSPPVPEAQERTWPEVEATLKRLKVSGGSPA